MPRIAPVDRKNPPATVAPQLAAVHAKLGVVPNLIATLAQSPVALNAYLGLSETLGQGALNAAERERIALVVAETNSCDYCLAAHSLIGKGAGLSEADIAAARQAEAGQTRDRALVRLARAIVETRGLVTASDLSEARSAGLSDADLLEVVVNVVVNLLTNYTNHLAQTEVDFPKARSLAA
jgi:uncharacterized peroxidase-related enzyme